MFRKTWSSKCLVQFDTGGKVGQERGAGHGCGNETSAVLEVNLAKIVS